MDRTSFEFNESDIKIEKEYDKKIKALKQNLNAFKLIAQYYK